jgi:hypothetical protein
MVQGDVALSKVMDGASISAIDRASAAIDRGLPMYHKVEKVLITLTDRGGAFTAYLERDQPRKVIVEIDVSNMDYIATYYFVGRRMIMATWTVRNFYWDNKKSEFDFTRYKSVTTNRYYFRDGRMIGWRSEHSKTMRCKHDAEFREKEHYFLVNSAKYRQFATSKKKELDVEKWIREGN